MAEIQLTRGMTALVSDEDVERISATKWFPVMCDNSKWYAMRSEIRGGKQRTVYMHRRIIGAQPGQMVDHINGDGLDNRRENIRLATPSQNCANRRSYTPASGFRGVYSARKRWLAMITVQGKNHRLGRFPTREEAARAYDAAAREHFGQFAVLNFAEGR